jgi:cytoskeletal protein RodZ
MKKVRGVLFALSLALLMMVAWGAVGVLLYVVFTPVAEAAEPPTWPVDSPYPWHNLHYTT